MKISVCTRPDCVRAGDHGGECVPAWTPDQENRLAEVIRRVTELEAILSEVHLERQDLERARRSAAEMRGM